jgi:type VI secretion system protein ImpE
MNPPTGPRDIFWRPARLVTKDGVDGDVLLAGLYPNTHLSADEDLKLGRATDWLPDSPDLTVGIGGRLYLSGGTPTPFVSITEIAVG